MRLKFSYEMTDSFSRPVEEHHFSMMCLPRDTNRQKVSECICDISPCSYRGEDKDFFGNRYIYGEVIPPHSAFQVCVQGIVETGLAPEEHADRELLELFRIQSGATTPGRNLTLLAEALDRRAPELSDPYANVLFFLHEVHALLTYDPAATDVSTTAEQAAGLRRGVCQDYAHIMISLLRRRGIPARYAVGMMIGEGASHAWVEANCRGYWYGLDPTNNRLVDEAYIKLSHGRDYHDCIINKGVFRNVCLEQKQVRLSVEKI